MSNLGGYQVFTTIAKKVGGPGRLVALIAGSGAVLGGLAVKGGEFAIKKGKKVFANYKKKNDQLYQNTKVKYIIKQDGESNEGLKLKAGDAFRVLESDHDVVLIELIDNEDNPYFVSKTLLEQISDYEE